MARIFDRKLAITYRCLQAVVLLGYLLGYKIGWQKVFGARALTHSGVHCTRAPGCGVAWRGGPGVVWMGELVRD